MLSKKQTTRLDVMCKRYLFAMKQHHKVSHRILFAWTLRYRIAMERVLQTECKR